MPDILILCNFKGNYKVIQIKNLGQLHRNRFLVNLISHPRHWKVITEFLN